MENRGRWVEFASEVRKWILSWLETRFCQRYSEELFHARERSFMQARLNGNVHRVRSLNDELALATQETLANRQDVTCRLLRTAKKMVSKLPSADLPAGEPVSSKAEP